VFLITPEKRRVCDCRFSDDATISKFLLLIFRHHGLWEEDLQCDQEKQRWRLQSAS
jgi:hypothetical protein